MTSPTMHKSASNAAYCKKPVKNNIQKIISLQKSSTQGDLAENQTSHG